MSENGKVYQLMSLVSRNMHHDAWNGHEGGVNPTLADAFRLAFTARFEWEPDEFGFINQRFSGGHWLGESIEHWYALACGAHPTAAVTMERYLGREPFLIGGERVYVGRSFDWEGENYRCTSIEKDLIRGKGDRWDSSTNPATKLPSKLITIPRAGAEAKIAADKAAAKAKRDAEREAKRADPIDLLSVGDHLRKECAGSPRPRRSYGSREWALPDRMADWADGVGTDYKRAWKECPSDWWRDRWAVCLGLMEENSRKDASKIPWSQVEQALFRFVRARRGLPLRAA